MFTLRNFSLALAVFIFSANFSSIVLADEIPVPQERIRGYILTPVQSAGENTIRKFEMIDGVMTPKYYRVDLAKTEYGEGDGVKYYEWAQNENGENELKEVSTPTDGKTTITAKYDTANSQTRFENEADKSTETITQNFVGQNVVTANANAYGGAIYNKENGKIGDVTGDFIGNYFNKNGFGAAIYNHGTIGEKDSENNVIGGIINSVFKDNYVKSYGDGAAVYTTKDLNIIADNGTTLFTNNLINTNSTPESQGIYVNSANNNGNVVTLTLKSVNNGLIQIDDKISGDKESEYSSGYVLSITGDSTSKIVLNNEVQNADVKLENTTLVLGDESVFDKAESLTLKSGTLDLQNGKTGNIAVPNLIVEGNVDIKLDADLSGTGSVDKFAPTTSIDGSGNLNISSINILKDFEDGTSSISLSFMDGWTPYTSSLADSAKSYMTSKFTYEITKENDAHTLNFAIKDKLGGIAAAIENKPPVTEYFITEATEVLDKWSSATGNVMQGDELNIHGNGNNLDGNGNKGIFAGDGKTLTIDSVGSYTISDAKKEDDGSFAKIDKNGNVTYHTVSHSTGMSNFSDIGTYDNGGAISATKSNTKITNTVFSKNTTTYTPEKMNPSMGGAIFNYNANLQIDKSLFAGNKVESNFYTYGGAVAVRGSGHTVVSDSIFVNNKTHSIYDDWSYSQSEGGALYYEGFMNGDTTQEELAKLDIINSSFDRNETFSEQNHAFGGAVYISGMKSYDDVRTIDVSIKNSTFTNNIARVENGLKDFTTAQGGAIYVDQMSDLNFNVENSYFDGNSAKSKLSNAQGGAISMSGRGDRNIVNSIFTNNTAVVDSPLDDTKALGGAIYADTSFNIIADNGLTKFSGNKTIENGVEEQNAILIDTSYEQDVTLEAKNNGVIQFDDTIKGGTYTWIDGTRVWVEDLDHPYNLNLTGDTTGKIVLNNDVKNANVTMDTVNLNLGKNNVFETSNVTVNSGTLGFVNGIAESQTMHSLNINGNTNLALDVNLAEKTIDTLPDNTTVSPDININVSYLNLLNDATSDKTTIAFAPEDYANQVSYTGENPIAYSKIYKYNITYGQNPEDNLGYFTFVRGNSSNPSDNFNPSVLAPSVATQAGAYTTQLQTFNYAFQHSDAFMNIPYLDRMAIKNRNKYALSPTSDATDVGTFSPLLTHDESAGFWFKPYASFESVPLKNGPKVSNINYGTLVGYDSALKSISHGFDRVLTGYIGYNGASQRYSGVDAYQNGGIIGGTTTFYKNNFFNATTLSVGATAGDAKSMYGSENYTMLLAGIANKTGYNFEFKQGKIILQPSMLISYSFVNTFDYNNAAGLRIKSDPLNAIQLAPGLKLIGNTQNGWQPYIGVSMVWNLLDKSKVTADDVRLPEMSIKPYVQYGVGVQKRFGERATGYAQAMLHSGGRNGVSLTAGFRWAVGKR